LKYPFYLRPILLILGASFSACTPASPPIELENGTVTLSGDLKINQIQVLGTHNSYARPVDSAVLAFVDRIMEQNRDQFEAAMDEEARKKYKENHPNMLPMSEALAYDHPSFPVQLDNGMRSLEIDVYYDPTGNRFNRPAAYEMLRQMGRADLLPFDSSGLGEPGFKVLHVADMDFRTHYSTFKEALTTLKNWSDAHPTHTPIFIMIEAKDKGLPLFPNPTEVLPFSEKAFDQLDAEILSVLGKEKVITPDQVRGDFKTLEEAVLAQNWPSLSEALGKFVFMLLPASAGIEVEGNAYIQNHPSLEGRAMFVQSAPGQAHAAFLLLDNALVREEEIRDAVSKGYLVRSRADIDCYEAKVNDKTRAQMAFASGAQVVSTDFFRPGNAFGTEYYVTLPSDKPVRANPVNADR